MMKSMMTKVWRFFRRDEEGAAMVEYALLVALIAVVVVLALGPLGQAISTMFNTITGSI